MTIRHIAPGSSAAQIASFIEKAQPHRVLDLATGSGDTLSWLLGLCTSHTRFVGIDIMPSTLAKARSRLTDPRVSCAVMDAAHLGCTEGSFDLITLFNSLHHLPDISRVTEEILCALTPGGSVLVSEMHRDNLSPPQRVHTDMHQWWAEVDTAAGLYHGPIYWRADILAMIERMALEDIVVLDDPGDAVEELDPRWQQDLATRCDTYAERIVGHPRYRTLKGRGQRIKRRFAETGFAQVPRLTISGVKPLR